MFPFKLRSTLDTYENRGAVEYDYTPDTSSQTDAKGQLVLNFRSGRTSWAHMRDLNMFIQSHGFTVEEACDGQVVYKQFR